MRIVALLAVRNEELYMERCLEHLFSQGVETCVIDNGSTDRTRRIVERFMGRGVFRIEAFPYPGYFDLAGQLQTKEALATEIDADWFIHHDADEIREAPAPFSLLRDGIESVDAQGYSAINFDEFVFVPTSSDDRFENRDYVAEMRHYYFFQRARLHRVNAWKKSAGRLDLASSGGHQARFDERRIYPETFVLRHYIVLSAPHACLKYGSERVYSENEITELGWHGTRATFSPEKFRLPPPEGLKQLALGAGAESLDRSDPKTEHLLFD